MMIDKIKRAKIYATEQHKDQKRKGNGIPYITHLEAVYNLAKTVTDDVSTLAACWLHDTIEDTNTTYKDLVDLFGIEIADIVNAVSEDKNVSWEESKEKYINTVFLNKKAIVVAWADKMHNTADLANVADFSVFKRPLKQKLDFYSKFALKIKDKKLRTRLKLVLDNIYTMSYIKDR